MRESISIFSASTSINKIDELLTSGSLSAKTKLRENFQKFKPFVLDLSEPKLNNNRTLYLSRAIEIKDHYRHAKLKR